MNITVNGESQEQPDGQTVHELIVHLGLDKGAVAVEVNQELIPRRDHQTTPLAQGDQVELVTLVGGG